MKSLKKTLVLLVVFSMILSTLVPAFAFTDADKLVEADCEEAVARMVALEIINGYAEDNTFRPEGSIKRSEMAKIICKMVGIDEGTVSESGNVASKFSDVPAGAWYAGYVNVAAGRGIINGFPDGSFRPEDPLTMNQVLTLVVNALGRGEHVSTMGTWPANYIAEAAKLGLIDDVKTVEKNGVKVTEPNRGNVAIICWNTLKAPYVWDVENTEYQGNINLGNSSRSLLSIYFRDFVYTNDKDVEFFKEAEYLTVKTAPSMNKDLGSRQIILDTTNNTDFAKIKDDFELAAPRKDEETATWLNGADLVAYVPEAVCEDLESLYGKEVRVIFGEDNVVAAIIVTNDSFVDNELVEKVDIADDKITIADETYKYYPSETEVYVNGVSFGKGETQIEKVLTAIGVDSTSTRSLTKALKANVILDNKNKVERIDFTISGLYYIDGTNFTDVAADADYSIAQYIVEKVKTKGDVMAVGTANAIYNYQDLIEDEEEPKVVRGSQEISLDEIVEGDVLTVVYTGTVSTGTIRTIYVSSEKVTGEANVKNTLVVTIDDTKYLANNAAKMTSTGELKEATTTVTYTELKKIADEEVELYLNILGEYVALVSDSSAADGLFGVVTNVSKIFEDEDNDFAEYRSIKIMLPDGEQATRYQLVYDEAKDHTEGANEYTLAQAENLENKLITFKAGADNKIMIEDVTVAEAETVGYVDGVEGKVVTLEDAATINYDKKRINGTKEYSFSGAKFLNYATNDDEVETLSKGWKSLVAKTDDGKAVSAVTKLANINVVVDENDDVLLVYSKINSTEFVPSDDIFAIVTNIDHKETGKETVTVKTVSGEEETYEAGTKNLLTDKGINVADFVMFTVKDGKIDLIEKLFDVIAMNDLKADAKINGETKHSCDGEAYACPAPATCTTANHTGHGDAIAWAHASGCTASGACDETCTESTPCTPDATEWESCKQLTGSPENGTCTTPTHIGYRDVTVRGVNTVAKLSGTSVAAIVSAIVDNDTTKENLAFDYNENREDRLYYTEDVTAGTNKVASAYINNSNLVIIDLSDMTEDCEGIEFIDSLEEIDGETVIAITINDDTDDDDEGAEILVVIK